MSERGSERTSAGGSYGAADAGEAARLRAQATRLWHAERDTLRRLGLGDGLRLLEVGCGSGALLANLRSDFAPRQLIGVDVADDNVRRARSVAPVARADGAALPFADASVDAVLFRFVLRHAPRPEALLAEAQRVLVPGGLVVTIDADDAALFFDPEPEGWPRLHAALESAARRHGGEPRIGRTLRRRLLDAGFIEPRAEVMTVTTEQVAAPAFVEVFLAPAARPVDAALCDEEAAKSAWAALRRWSARDDAFGCAAGWFASAKKRA